MTTILAFTTLAAIAIVGGYVIECVFWPLKRRERR